MGSTIPDLAALSCKDKLVLAKLQTMHAGFNRHGTTVGLSGKAKSERASCFAAFESCISISQAGN